MTTFLTPPPFLPPLPPHPPNATVSGDFNARLGSKLFCTNCVCLLTTRGQGGPNTPFQKGGGALTPPSLKRAGGVQSVSLEINFNQVLFCAWSCRRKLYELDGRN